MQEPGPTTHCAGTCIPCASSMREQGSSGAKAQLQLDAQGDGKFEAYLPRGPPLTEISYTLPEICREIRKSSLKS